MTSINTNIAATTALRTLQQTNAQLDATQNRISTGLKIGEAKDNAAYWSISTSLKSDNKALATVKDSLNLGAAAVDVAYQAMNSVRDVLDEMRTKLTTATGATADKAAIQSDITNLKALLESYASSASFAGENWLSVNSGGLGFTTERSVVSSFTRGADGNVTLGSIKIDTGSMVLFDSNASGSGLIDGKATLKNANGDVLNFGGSVRTPAPAADALEFASPVVGGALVAAKGAVAEMNIPDFATVKSGDRFTFAVTLNDGAATNVSLSTTGITSNATLVDAMQDALDTAFGANAVTASVNTAGKLQFATVATGTAASIAVATASRSDMDGVVTSTAGLTSGNSTAIYGTAEAASVTSTDFTPAGTTNGDKLTFEVQFGNQIYRAEHTYVAADFADDANPTAAEFRAVLQAAINAAVSAEDGTTQLGSNKIVVGGSGNDLTFTTFAKGEDQVVGLSRVQTYQNGSTTADATPDATIALGLSDVADIDRGSATAATYAPGFVFDNDGVVPGDTIEFGLNVNGTVKIIEVSTEGMTGLLADKAADATRFKANVQAALDAEFTGANAVKFDLNTSTFAMSFSTVDKGDDVFITMGTVNAKDGDGVVSTLPGFTNVARQTGTAEIPAGNARVTASNAFTGSVTYGLGDSASFSIALGGASPVAAQTLTINRDVINAALLPASANGTIADASEFETVLNYAISQNALLDGKVSASVDGAGFVTFEKLSNGGVGTITVTDASVSSPTGHEISIENIDIASDAFKLLTQDQQRQAIEGYIAIIGDRISKTTAVAADLGSVSKRIDTQKSFVNTLMDTIEKGVSGLIDADMNEESTRLQALQVKQQLGVQALSIANQSAQNVLSLFR